MNNGALLSPYQKLALPVRLSPHYLQWQKAAEIMFQKTVRATVSAALYFVIISIPL
jgi:hypothetical protein